MALVMPCGTLSSDLLQPWVVLPAPTAGYFQPVASCSLTGRHLLTPTWSLSCWPQCTAISSFQCTLMFLFTVWWFYSVVVCNSEDLIVLFLQTRIVRAKQQIIWGTWSVMGGGLQCKGSISPGRTERGRTGRGMGSDSQLLLSNLSTE